MISRLTIPTALFAALLLLPALAHGQTDKEIAQRTKELEKLRNEILAYEKRIKESESKERSALEHLDNLEKQSTLIRRLIQKLREEEKTITAEIAKAKEALAEMNLQLDHLKEHYANYVRSVYKNGRVYDLELLFSSNSVNQLSIRIEYLKRFSDQRARDLQSIVEKKTSLEQQNEQLQSSLQAERRLLAEKTREEQTLQKKTGERKTVLSKARSDKQTYQKELARRTAAAREMERIIADLVERERIRKEKEAQAARERSNAGEPIRPEPATTFDQRRGKLRWPVSSGAIASRFGQQVHPTLKTITQNTGIDISVPVGSDVVAVADGEVSVLSFIPGYGNLLILNHYGGYRTVYAHLSDIAVSEEQAVREGQVIARSGDSLSGAVLHFEIWKDREKQNPEWWLVKAR
jgi:septal ring factor EnvC (AmiA/AmiB activator)